MGELILPDLTFAQAMRVSTRVTLSPSVGETIVRRQSIYLFECFGQVASVTSRDAEDTENFTQAVDMRRFGL